MPYVHTACLIQNFYMHPLFNVLLIQQQPVTVSVKQHIALLFLTRPRIRSEC